MKRICQDESVSHDACHPHPHPPEVVPPNPSIPVVEAQVLHRLPADVVCEQGAADPVPARPTGAPVVDAVEQTAPPAPAPAATAFNVNVVAIVVVAEETATPPLPPP